jgi:transposase
MRKIYPSDITREQFEKIQPLLESVRKKTRPRTLDLYDVFCGVLYVLKSGCQWNMLPAEFGNHKTVHKYFMQWNERKKIGRKKQPSILEEILKKIRWRGSYVQWTERENKHGHR